MATLVKNKKNGRVYILIGTGYGAYMATRPSLLGGNLFPREDKGQYALAAICNEKGDINWVYTDDLKVIEVDGVKIEDVLKANK